MGTASFSPNLSGRPQGSIVSGPVQALLAFLGRSKPIRAKPQSTVSHPAQSSQTVTPLLAPSRLRVLREFEPGIAPSFAGRMVISGRMADVCAELDRMTQRESSSLQTDSQSSFKSHKDKKLANERV